MTVAVNWGNGGSSIKNAEIKGLENMKNLNNNQNLKSIKSAEI